MLYCVKCKQKTDSINITEIEMKNRRTRLSSTCTMCGSKKSSFAACDAKEGGSIDIHALIGKLPRPNGGWTLPNHKYTGPWNPLHEQLDKSDNPLPGKNHTIRWMQSL